MAVWGKLVASGFKVLIQCFPSSVLASVLISDAAADTNTDTNIVTDINTKNRHPFCRHICSM